MAEGEALTDGEEDPRREGAEDELRADDGKGEEEHLARDVRSEEEL